MGGVVEAGVFVDLDASASMTLTVEATGAEKSVTVQPRALDPAVPGLSDEDKPSGYKVSGIMIPRGSGMIGEDYFARRSPAPFSIGDAFGAVKDKVSDAATAVGDAAKNVGNKVVDTAKNVGSKVADTAKNVGNKVVDTAKNVGSKIGDAASAVKDKASSVVNSVTGKDEPKKDPKTLAKAPPKPSTSKAAAKATSTTKTKATSTKASSTAATPKSTKKAAPAPAAPATSDASFGGCFEVGAGLDVNVGADANFFELFNPSTKVPLFSKKFSLFKVGPLVVYFGNDG